MREGVKMTLWIVMLGLVFAGSLLWSRTGLLLGSLPVVWMLRIVVSLAALATISALVWSKLRKEKLPDYLRQIVRRPLEANGVCLGFVAEAVEGGGGGASGGCELHVYSQNRFARPCTVSIRLYREYGFAVSQKNLELMSFTIACEGGAFGLTRIPIAVSRKYHGKKCKVSVQAEVKYPAGRGELLRFKAGRMIATRTDRTVALTVLLGLGGGLLGAAALASQRTYFKMKFPKDIGEQVPDDARAMSETLWTPGDEVVEFATPPLAMAA